MPVKALLRKVKRYEIYFWNYTVVTSLWGLHLIVVKSFEYTDDPASYTGGSVANGRVSHAG
jgi:hypothetical protein